MLRKRLSRSEAQLWSDDELRRSQHCKYNACEPSGQRVTRPALSKRTRALNVEVRLCRSAVAICRQAIIHQRTRVPARPLQAAAVKNAMRRSQPAMGLVALGAPKLIEEGRREKKTGRFQVRGTRGAPPQRIELILE